MKEQTVKSALFSILSIVFLDLLGVGIAIPVIALLFLSPEGILPAMSFAQRTILLGFLVVTYPLAQFFGAPLLGGLSDRIGRKKVLFLSLLGTFIGYIVFALGVINQNIMLLFASRIIDGFTGGNISIALSAIADISDEKSKAKNFGLIGMTFGLGFTLGPYVGGKLSDPLFVPWFNLATPFWFAAILTIFNIMMMFWKFPETNTHLVHKKISVFTGIKNIQTAFQLINLRTIFIVSFLLALGFNFFTQFFQVFLIEKFHYTQGQIGNIFAYIGLWIAITQGIITGPLTKRFAPAVILRYSSIALGLTFPFLILPSHSYFLFLIIPFIAIFQGMIHPNTSAIVSSLAAKDSQGEVLGISQSIYSLAQAIPPIIAGFIVYVHLNLPIIVASICTVIAGVIFIAFFKAQKKETFMEV